MWLDQAGGANADGCLLLCHRHGDLSGNVVPGRVVVSHARDELGRHLREAADVIYQCR